MSEVCEWVGDPGERTVSELKPCKTLHQKLVVRAARWLKRQGCGVVLHDPCHCPANREQPDAIGWRDGLSIVVEVKTSRADFFADKKKPFRHDDGGMGNWRFYMAPRGLLSDAEMPEGWRLLEATEHRVFKSESVPPNTRWHSDKPFIANREAECRLLVSAWKKPDIWNTRSGGDDG